MGREAWRVVEDFERALCEYTGATHCVATDSCTNALYLCFERGALVAEMKTACLPRYTYVGVVQAALRAGLEIEWIWGTDAWVGEYKIPTHKGWIVDAARWLRRGMYKPETWTCLSFHATKHLPIGRGGAILCDNAQDAEWFRRARYDGRDQTKPILEQDAFQFGVQCYLEPEKAARGLLLMTALKDDNEPLPGVYPDLSQVRWT